MSAASAGAFWFWFFGSVNGAVEKIIAAGCYLQASRPDVIRASRCMPTDLSWLFMLPTASRAAPRPAANESPSQIADSGFFGIWSVS